MGVGVLSGDTKAPNVGVGEMPALGVRVGLGVCVGRSGESNAPPAAELDWPANAQTRHKPISATMAALSSPVCRWMDGGFIDDLLRGVHLRLFRWGAQELAEI